MKTNVQKSSLVAYSDLKKEGLIQPQQMAILSVMQPFKTYTRREIAHISGIETSTVSARINSLLETHIEVVGVKKDPITNKNVQALKLKEAA